MLLPLPPSVGWLRVTVCVHPCPLRDGHGDGVSLCVEEQLSAQVSGPRPSHQTRQRGGLETLGVSTSNVAT